MDKPDPVEQIIIDRIGVHIPGEFRSPTESETATVRDSLIGTQMPDGSVYAGVSPKTGKNMYVSVGSSPGDLLTWEETQVAMKNLAPHGWRLPSRDEAIRDAASARRASDPIPQNISAMWSDSSTGVALPKTYEGVAVFKKDDIKPGGPV
jgi:hypothetical protein